MAEKRDKKKVEETIQAVGATAEMSLIFYRAAIEAGADAEEAVKLTQAYLVAAMIAGRQQQKLPESEEG